MTRCRPNTCSSHQALLYFSLPLFFSTSFLRLFLGCAVRNQASYERRVVSGACLGPPVQGCNCGFGRSGAGHIQGPCDTVWTTADHMDNVKTFYFVAVFFICNRSFS